MKKIIVFGGGTGLSCLLSGLKQFPLEVTTVVAVSDNGSSTGILKEELNIPAVGDIGKVLISMANADDEFLELLGYRFSKDGSLYNHPIRNILLAALIDMKGSLTEATRYMCSLLNIRGTVLPLTEEKVELVGETHPGTDDYFGEVEVSKHISNIIRLSYDHDIQISQEISEKILSADLIIFSPGSLYTSILPHLIAPQVRKAINETSAPLMYVANLVTQPGETDEMSVSQHVAVLNKRLDQRKIDCVIANKGSIDQTTSERYKNLENKDLVLLDQDKLDAMGAATIADDLIRIDELGKIRHDELRTAFLIFSYLMKYVD